MAEKQGYIAVDLDGTLAHYDTWQGADHVGEPIQPMLARVQQWLAEGKDVRIFTARVSNDSRGETRPAIEAWCAQHLGTVLPIICTKDYDCLELWDDRAVQVITNTGMRADGKGATPVADIVNRLRGRYPMGPLGADGEPKCGWREMAGTMTVEYPTPLMVEAANVIQEQAACIADLEARMDAAVGLIERLEWKINRVFATVKGA
jgi:hypothetical protein